MEKDGADEALIDAGATSAAPAGADAGAGEERVLDGIMDAVVTRIYPKNRMFLEARLGGQTINVRVRSNEHFVEGMQIESRYLARVNERVFDFVGRCPRARGRW